MGSWSPAWYCPLAMAPRRMLTSWMYAGSYDERSIPRPCGIVAMPLMLSALSAMRRIISAAAVALAFH